MGKSYDVAMLCGRFQHFHIGHQSLVEHALNVADRMIILVGSSQEFGTERNPFDISTRIDVIREIYNDDNRITVKPLPDLTHENDITPDWGRYVLKSTNHYIHKVPEVMIYGNDEARSRWFDPEDIKDTLEIVVPRSKIKISATEIRKMLVKDDRERWMQFVHPRLHKMYDLLRAELLSCDFYRQKFEELMKK